MKTKQLSEWDKKLDAQTIDEIAGGENTVLTIKDIVWIGIKKDRKHQQEEILTQLSEYEIDNAICGYKLAGGKWNSTLIAKAIRKLIEKKLKTK